LEVQAKNWGQILAKLGRLEDSDRSKDFKIKSIETGSTIVTLYITPATAIAIGLIVKQVLSIYEKTLDIRKKQLEIEELELDNEQKKAAVSALEIGADKVFENKLEDVVKAVTEKIKTKTKNEEKVAIRSSAKDIYNFIVNGGVVEFNTHSQKDENKELQLAPVYKKIDEIETGINNLKLLRGKATKQPAEDKLKEDKKREK